MRVDDLLVLRACNEHGPTGPWAVVRISDVTLLGQFDPALELFVLASFRAVLAQGAATSPTAWVGDPGP